MNVRRYLLRKVGYVVLTAFLITSLNFFLIQVLPGDPTYALLPRGGATQNFTDLRQTITHLWGLDQPVMVRYVLYLNNLLHGNWGYTITFHPGTPVADVLYPSLSNTLVFVGLATIVTMFLGQYLGRISGWKRGTKTDVTITLGTLAGYSMPSFWVSLVLVYFLAFIVPIFPEGDLHTTSYLTLDPLTQVFDELYHLVLPILTFVITNVAWYSLTLRNSLTDVLPEDYMVTARAKGLSERERLRRHAMPNARLPFVTASALYFGWVVSGVIVIEQVFNLNGIGTLTWNATTNRDYPLLSAVFLIATLGVVIANAIADVLYMYLDPRVKEA